MSDEFSPELEQKQDELRVTLNGGNGKRPPPNTIHSYHMILEEDPKFKNVQFNEIGNRAEDSKVKDSELVTERWTDADDAEAQEYIERVYGIYAPNKYEAAMKLRLKKHTYNPVKNEIESVEWDKTSRIFDFLHIWMKCEDTPYTREVSRLIFAGGINRLYNPGCKFDDVPVLIGTKQGEGKSTVIRYLAILDEFYGEATSFEDKPSIEQLEGKWVMEISEMLALTRKKEQEAAKAYLARAVDKFRPTYGKNTVEMPRRCFFVGTTNDPMPLTDKTGNRRWYPVYVNSSGYDIFDKEPQIREYIRQCWAEALHLYTDGKLPAYADKQLRNEILLAQSNATAEDWADEAIKTYLADKSVGDLTCTLEIYKNVVDEYRKPTKTDLKPINILLAKLPDWENTGTVARFTELNTTQRAWRKISPTEPKLVEVVSRGDDEPPF